MLRNGFDQYYPQNKVADPKYHCIRGRYVSFVHHDVADPQIVETFDRRIKRFMNILNNASDTNSTTNSTLNLRLTFVRTVMSPEYNTELSLNDQFERVMAEKYPNVDYTIFYVIPEQVVTSYWKALSDHAYVFTMDDRRWTLTNLFHHLCGEFYRDIFKQIVEIVNNRIPKDVNLNPVDSDRMWFSHTGVPPDRTFPMVDLSTSSNVRKVRKNNVLNTSTFTNKMEQFLKDSGIPMCDGKIVVPDGTKHIKLDVGLSYSAPMSQVWLTNEPDLAVYAFEPKSYNIESVKSGCDKLLGSHGAPLEKKYVGTQLWVVPCALTDVAGEEEYGTFYHAWDHGTGSLYVPNEQVGANGGEEQVRFSR